MSAVQHQSVVGRSIVSVRRLSGDELSALMWTNDASAFAIVLDDGTEIIAARDSEMNDAGVFVVFHQGDYRLILGDESTVTKSGRGKKATRSQRSR